MKTTKIYVIKLFRLLLDYENALEFVRHKLVNKKPDLAKIFDFLDLGKNKLIGKQEIKRIMSFKGYSIGEEESERILERFDRNKTCQIGFKEFASEINPKLQVLKKK